MRAWIETYGLAVNLANLSVALRVRAWIETCISFGSSRYRVSPSA